MGSFYENLANVFGDIAKDFDTLATDVQRLVQDEKDKKAAQVIEEENASKKEKDKKEVPIVAGRRLRSLQRLTTFYKSEKEAVEVQDDPVLKFVDKRLKEIFRR